MRTYQKCRLPLALISGRSSIRSTPYTSVSAFEISTLGDNLPKNLDICLAIEGDVGGQKTLRSFWRNHFEETDALIWVIDSNDRLRLDDCKRELVSLLQEEVLPFSCSRLLDRN